MSSVIWRSSPIMVKVVVNSLFTSTTNIIVTEGSRKIWLVDCGDDNVVTDFVREGNLVIGGILLTHGHFDHIYGLNGIIGRFPDIRVYTSDAGAAMISDPRKNMSHYWGHPLAFSFPGNVTLVEDGDQIDLGNGLLATAVFTPGHNPSCITWVVDDCIFTGDSYIPGIKTVTNLPGGNRQQAEESLSLIKKLSDGKKIYPGHNINLKL